MGCPGSSIQALPDSQIISDHSHFQNNWNIQSAYLQNGLTFKNYFQGI